MKSNQDPLISRLENTVRNARRVNTWQMRNKNWVRNAETTVCVKLTPIAAARLSVPLALSRTRNPEIIAAGKRKLISIIMLG